MTRVITVEREYGSRGGEFAHALAERLGWRLIDHCLVDEIALQSGLSASAVANCDERFDPWYYRLGRTFWHGSIERLPAIMSDAEPFDSERMNTLVRRYLAERVAEGHCVVVGRGAAIALSREPGVFNVFVYASMARKLAWFREHFPDRAEDAEAELLATDRRRAAHIRRFFAQDWNDYRLYQLMLNSCTGIPAMLSSTLEASGIGAAHPVA